jgi:hypothetical protein
MAFEFIDDPPIERRTASSATLPQRGSEKKVPDGNRWHDRALTSRRTVTVSGPAPEGCMKQHEQAEQKVEADAIGVTPDAPGAGQNPADRRASARLKPQVQDHIGRQLRAVYDDVLKQPLPDRFRELMEKLDRTTGERE